MKKNFNGWNYIFGTVKYCFINMMLIISRSVYIINRAGRIITSS